MNTIFETAQDRIAYMKVAFAKKQAEKKALATSIERNDLCLLDALGCIAFGEDNSLTDEFCGDRVAREQAAVESYMMGDDLM